MRKVREWEERHERRLEGCNIFGAVAAAVVGSVISSAMSSDARDAAESSSNAAADLSRIQAQIALGQHEWAKEDRERFNTEVLPLIKETVKNRMPVQTKEQAIAEAVGDVRSQHAQADQRANRALELSNRNPSDPVYAQLNRSLASSEAGDVGRTVTAARNWWDDKNWTRNVQAIGLWDPSRSSIANAQAASQGLQGAAGGLNAASGRALDIARQNASSAGQWGYAGAQLYKDWQKGGGRFPWETGTVSTAIPAPAGGWESPEVSGMAPQIIDNYGGYAGSSGVYPGMADGGVIERVGRAIRDIPSNIHRSLNTPDGYGPRPDPGPQTSKSGFRDDPDEARRARMEGATRSVYDPKTGQWETLRYVDEPRQARADGGAVAPRPINPMPTPMDLAQQSALARMLREMKRSDTGPGTYGAVQPRADGGEIEGPGTGTSDSIRAIKAPGTYILSADTVRAVGTKKLRKMMDEAGVRPGEGESSDQRGVHVALSNGEWAMPPAVTRHHGEDYFNKLQEKYHKPIYAPGDGDELANGGVVPPQGTRKTALPRSVEQAILDQLPSRSIGIGRRT